MGLLQIRLAGGMRLAEEECRDEFGLPFLPAYLLRGALRSAGLPELEELELTHARIAHYDAICSMLGGLEYPEAVFEPFVFSHFYAERELAQGLVFEAHIEAPEAARERIESAAEALDEIYDADGTPLGRVEARADWNSEVVRTPDAWHATWYMDKEYTSLSYTLQARSPLCFQTPYESKSTTRSYVEGGWMRQAILRGLGDAAEGFLREGEIICSHAFPVIDAKRSMPSSYSFATKKLDKTDLRDRISEGKRLDDRDQLVAMRGGFVDDVRANDVAVTSVDKCRAHVGPARLAECISEGQRFSGRISGTTHQLRAVYELLIKNPIIQIGDLTEAGCGEALCRVEGLETQREASAPQPLCHFDVFCVSPVILTNEYGLTDCSTGAFIKEIEYWLNAEGRLEAEKVFRETAQFNSTDSYWRQNGAYILGIDQGSVYRIRTKDGAPVDVSPLEGARLGERAREGYGDVLVTEAVDAYYRKCESVTPDMYSLKIPVSEAALKESAKLRDRLLYDCMRNALDAIGRIDAADCEDYNTIRIPMELLELQAERYEQNVPQNLLRKWYLDSMLAEIELLNPEQEVR